MLVLVLGFFISFSCFSGFFLVSDPRGRLGGLGRKAGSAYEESEDNEGDIRVNVSVSSGADSHSVSSIKC